MIFVKWKYRKKNNVISNQKVETNNPSKTTTISTTTTTINRPKGSKWAMSRYLQLVKKLIKNESLYQLNSFNYGPVCHWSPYLAIETVSCRQFPLATDGKDARNHHKIIMVSAPWWNLFDIRFITMSILCFYDKN